MKKINVYDNLVHDPNEIEKYFDNSPGLEKHMNFSLQFDFSEQVQWSQIIS